MRNPEDTRKKNKKKNRNGDKPRQVIGVSVSSRTASLTQEADTSSLDHPNPHLTQH